MRSVIPVFIVIIACLSPVTAKFCKAVPGTPGWPHESSWNALNATLGGQLIKPVPPGAVCHPDQPTYDATNCPSVKVAWTNFSSVLEAPVRSAWNNFDNDTCLPDSQYPCSGAGYPQYVVNATNAAHVKAGVDFARKNNIRLIVKGTGHDYLGRSSAPNSLSIWTHNLRGLKFSSNFQPKSCKIAANTSAVTISAGEILKDIYAAADAKGLVIVGGQALDVGIGGYITAGGHGQLSVLYGLAADQVLEATIVTPSGQILTINEKQNSEYFYAFRGGGPGFGVLIDVSVKTFPTPPITALKLEIKSDVADDTFFDQMAYLLTQYPYLSSHDISGYPYIYPVYATSATTTAAVYTASWLIHDGTSEGGMTEIFAPIIQHLRRAWPEINLKNSTSKYPTFYAHYKATGSASDAGKDQVLGSRLLSADVLSGDLDALTTAVKGFIGYSSASGASPFLLGGKGVANAVPTGGSDSVLPAWRSSLAHFASNTFWQPLNAMAKAEAMAMMDEQIQFLRDLAPESGAYINEAYVNEPNWQETFWGANYPKLWAIKRTVDPTDVFWCHPCVGGELWEEVGNKLCRI